MKKIITGYETWAHHYDPEKKRQSMEYRYKESPQPKKVKTQALAGKVMLTVFWNSEGVVLADFLEKETTITLILRRSRTGTVWFYTSTSNKTAARPKLYTKSLTRDLKHMYSRFTLVRISINL